MARARNIKPGFFSNEILAECQPLARLLFAGLWTLADREGRLEDRPRKIKAEILPYDNCDPDELLDNLANRCDEDGSPAFIIRYKSNSKSYIQILNFTHHQNPHPRESASIIPACSGTDNTQAIPRYDLGQTLQRTSPAESPIPLIPISESLLPITTTESMADKFDPAEIESRSHQVFETFEKGFGRTLNAIEVGKIKYWLERHTPELIEHALEIAVLGNNRSCKYIGGILNNWYDKGIKCVLDVEELDKRHQDLKKQAAGQFKNRASPVETHEFYTPPEVLEELKRQSG
jgi:DnaD/phage-associated family protein